MSSSSRSTRLADVRNGDRYVQFRTSGLIGIQLCWDYNTEFNACHGRFCDSATAACVMCP